MKLFKSKKLKIFLSLIAISITVSGCSVVNLYNTKPQKLYIIRVNDKYGFINRQGKVIIEPEYDKVSYSGDLETTIVSVNELIGVCKDQQDKTKCGYINSQGKIVIPLQFDYVYPFSEGFATVEIKGEEGCLDTLGKYITNRNYDKVYPFSEGLAVVCKTDDITSNCGYINKDGQEVISLKYIEGGPFSEGLAPVNIGGKWGYIDKNNKMVIKPQFDEAGCFKEGLALVSYVKETENEHISWGGYINKQGNFVIKLDTTSFNNRPFKEGLATTSDCKYFDKSGKIVLDPEKLGFDPRNDVYCQPFSEGLLGVMYGNEQYGYINKKGELKIKIKANGAMGEYISIGPFSENFAYFCYNDKCGYIDKAGATVIKPIFDNVNSFNGGLAWASLGNKTGYIDKTGRFVWSYFVKKEDIIE
jgi:hypothetical protein